MSFWARNNTYAPHPKIGVPVLIYAKNDAKEEKEKENVVIFSPNLAFWQPKNRKPQLNFNLF